MHPRTPLAIPLYLLLLYILVLVYISEDIIDGFNL